MRVAVVGGPARVPDRRAAPAGPVNAQPQLVDAVRVALRGGLAQSGPRGGVARHAVHRAARERSGASQVQAAQRRLVGRR